MEVKRVKEPNKEVIYDLIVNFKEGTFDKQKINRFIEDENNYLLVCTEEQKVVGFILAYQLHRFDGQSSMMYLHEIDVLNSYRKRGIGTLMLDYLKDICEEENVYKLFLITNESNQPAMSFYKHTGGEIVTTDDVVFQYYNFK